jgi:hypothetical protein
MELPDDIARLVKEYAQPLTRPDWRRLRRMEEMTFLHNIAFTYNTANKHVIREFIHMYETTKGTNYKYLINTHSRPLIIHLYRNK